MIPRNISLGTTEARLLNKMATLTNGWLKHTAQKAEHISKGQSLPLLWWLVAQTAVSLWFSSPALVPCLLDFLPMLVQSPTSPGEKREAL